MKKLLVILTILFTSLLFNSSLIAQISKGGTPPSFVLDGNTLSKATAIDMRSFPTPDLQQIMVEDEINDNLGLPPRVGVILKAGFNMENSGTWTELPNGEKVWRLEISSFGAEALNLYFDDFYLPPKSKLFIYTKDKSHVIGAFTEINNKETGRFATELVFGDEIIIEYVAPFAPKTKGITLQATDIKNNPILSISDVGYAYRYAHPLDALKIDESEYCEVDINCPEGDNWHDEERGVARLLFKEGASYYWCTGSLVNNTSQDFTNYFLLAFHCGAVASAADKDQWVFYFNYQKSDCGSGTYSEANTVTGCTMRALGDIDGGSDMQLLEISATPDDIDPLWEPYYNGWNRLNIASTSGVGIHHPAGDCKKISTVTSTATTDTWWDGTNTGATGAHWNVIFVATVTEHGVTEGGSSGSPFFNQNKNIVGTLSGGNSSCANPTGDNLYGKFWYHWDQNGLSDSDRLKPWLDPTNTGANVLSGMDIYTGRPNFTANNTTIYMGDAVDFTDLTSNNPVSWTWNFDGAAPATSSIQNPTSIQYDIQGDYNVSLTATNDNGTDTEEKVDYITVLPGGPSTVVWWSDFSSPGDWAMTDEGAGDDWVIGTTGPSGAFAINSIASTTAANNFAMFDSDALCSGNQLAHLTTVNSVADFSTYENVILKFEQYYRRYTDSTFVYVSNDNSNWDKYPVNEALGNNDFCAGNSDLVEIDISATAAFQSTLWIRFTFSSPSALGQDGCDYAWMVDDISIEGIAAGSTPPVTDFTATTNTHIPEGGTVDFLEQTSYATSWEWTFEGGIPSSSTLQNPPTITYGDFY